MVTGVITMYMRRRAMKRLIPILMLLMAAWPVVAQAPYGGEVCVTFGDKTAQGDNVTVRARVDLSRLELGSDNMLTFTPALRSQDGGHEIVFDPVVVSGARRAKILRRNNYFGGTATDVKPQNFHVRSGSNTGNILTLEYTVPFERWMRNSRMVVMEQVSGCLNEDILYADGLAFRMYEGHDYVFADPYKPTFMVSYLVPQPEPVKVVSDTYSAALSFVVNRTELRRDFGDNARILAESDEIIDRIKTDTLLSVSRIVVRGYASPEGTEAGNMRLSQGRAQAFVDYLRDKHNFYDAKRLITAEGMGEDWQGLRRALETSGLKDKTAILEIIDAGTSAPRKKAALKSLSGGETYRALLKEYYPPLRRNEYTISYEVRGFSAQEAARMIHTRPKLLSLNEFFMVAGLYHPAGDQYKQVFEIAAQVYPESEIAQFNVAAMEIENGAYDSAVSRLSDIGTPEAWNNLGVAYWNKGEYGQAKQYLQKAADAGSAEAVSNLYEYGKWLEDQE